MMKHYTKASADGAESARELENRRIAYEAACEGIVLLENDGTLPLKTKKVALYGPGAAMTIKGGTGSGEVNERHAVSVLEGMENRGFEITTRDWIEEYAAYYAQAEKDYRIEKRKRINLLDPKTINNMIFDNFRLPCGPAIEARHVQASDTDTCVYVLSRQAGEGGDRRAEAGDYYITAEERQAIAFCAANYAHFILLINCGSSMNLGFLESMEGINALLYICQSGSQGGNAVADILSGAVCPSGKLTDTWAKRYGDIPFADDYSHRNGDLKQENYREGIFVGYRYFDSFGVEPAYPFGFGRSYTDFEIVCTGVELAGSRVSLRAKVTNTGICTGKEVAQLYVSAPEGELNKEYQSLAAFGKTALLAPGEDEVLTLEFDLGAVSSYRERDNCFVLEQGDYILRLGNSSRNTAVAAVVTLEAEIVVSRHQSVCPLQSALEELQAPQRQPERLPDTVIRLTADAGAFQTEDYTTPYVPPKMDRQVRRFVGQLSVRQMADIVVGVGQWGSRNRFDLPGSVGNTTSKFWKKGLANVALCDGPAGLRINRHSTVNKRGKIRPVEFPLAVYSYIPGFIRKFLLGNPEKEQSLYQYATAFPVTNALAQSWNPQLLEQVGLAIAREMGEFGCTYWLAPAVNIHRNPLCGRNFEYFSEDPRLTGLLAAALTRGIQAGPGCYATVKHFACNNQEDNRTHVSSNVSQRALREIYLRGFETVVRQGRAKAVMTSYNKLNGVYTPNSYDLCTVVLRREWGFNGVVMTDWYSTNPRQGHNALAIAAGNDLIMPGGWYFKRQILWGLRTGKVTKQQLRNCCANVVGAILESATQFEYIGSQGGQP